MGRKKGVLGPRGSEISKASQRMGSRKEREEAVLKMTMILLEAVDGVHPYDVHAAMGATCAVGLIGEDLSALAAQGLIRRIPPRGHYGLPLKTLKPKHEQVMTDEPFIKPPSLARLMGCK
jgi:hypothetical protein